jgi:hypothetical protein
VWGEVIVGEVEVCELVEPGGVEEREEALVADVRAGEREALKVWPDGCAGEELSAAGAQLGGLEVEGGQVFDEGAMSEQGGGAVPDASDVDGELLEVSLVEGFEDGCEADVSEFGVVEREGAEAGEPASLRQDEGAVIGELIVEAQGD